MNVRIIEMIQKDEYYTIINIRTLDEDIKSCIKKSYNVRG